MAGQKQTLSKEVREIMQSDDNFFDITTIAEDNPFIKDMSELDIAIGACLHKHTPEETAEILDITVARIISRGRKSSVQRLVRLLVRGDVALFGVRKAYDTLLDVMNDGGQTATARIRASETVLKWAKELTDGDAQTVEGELSSMPVDALEAVVRALEDKKKTIENSGKPSPA